MLLSLKGGIYYNAVEMALLGIMYLPTLHEYQYRHSNNINVFVSEIWEAWDLWIVPLRWAYMALYM
jgi:hypothetical protein